MYPFGESTAGRLVNPQWRGLMAFSVVGFVLAGALPTPAQPPELVAVAEPLTPAEQWKRFHLPQGFRIELVAAEPQIKKPINLRFDAAGRLWVSTSVEYPHPTPPERVSADAIKVLADTDRDSTYETVTTFADRLNIPVGLIPTTSGLVAFSIPNIFQFADADGDGRAEEPAVLYGPFGFRDTHGLPSSFAWWLDGWVYGCQGQANASTVVDRSGARTALHGGCTFRFRPDGSRFELFAHGQVNPFGLCIDEWGDVFTADSHSRPAYLLLRGGWYPMGASGHDGLGFGPAIMRHFHCSTGIAGIVRYTADRFPPEYQSTLFIGNPVTRRINHDRLTPRGSSYEAVEQPDFLTCDDPWFRPVDRHLGPVGGVCVADFYNRIIGHNEVPLGDPRRDRQRGRIWRIVPTGGGQPLAPDLTTKHIDELLDFCGNGNLTLRVQAAYQLVARFGSAALEPTRRLLSRSTNAAQRACGVWILLQLGQLDNGWIARLADDAAPLVRVHLVKALAEIPDWGGAAGVPAQTTRKLLCDSDPFVRRAAADALGRHPARENLQPLLDAWSQAPSHDVLLVHTIRMALRDNLQSLACVADWGRAVSEQGARRRLADVCLGLPTAESAAFLLEHLQRREHEPPRLEEYLQHCLRWADKSQLPRAYALVRSFRNGERAAQRRVLRAAFRAAAGRSEPLPDDIAEWAVQLAQSALASDDEDELFTGIEVVLDLRLRPLSLRAAALAAERTTDPALRSLSLDALAAADPAAAKPVLATVVTNAAEPADLRRKAAELLGKIGGPESRKVLADALATAPATIAAVVAQQLASDPQGAELLLRAIEEGRASARLLLDVNVTQRLTTVNANDTDRRIVRLTAGLPSPDESLRKQINDLGSRFARARPNPRNGGKVFEQHCANCHELKGKGGKVGPQLDGVVARGLDRLLEDLLDPSHAVEMRYRATMLTLSDGRLVTGLIVREEQGTIVLVDSEGKETSLPTAAVQARRATTLSPMPADLVARLGDAQFFDLLAFLLDAAKK